VQVEAGRSYQPAFNRRGLVGGVVVQHEVHVQVCREFLVEFDQELLEFLGPVPAVQGPITLLVATSRAANSVVVPART